MPHRRVKQGRYPIQAALTCNREKTHGKIPAEKGHEQFSPNPEAPISRYYGI
jgi:hypothetical protein